MNTKLNISNKRFLRNYINEIIFGIILFSVALLAISMITVTQKDSLKSDLILKSTFLRDAIIEQSQLNFLLNDSIAFSELHEEVFENSQEVIKVSFYNAQKKLIWGPPSLVLSQSLLDIDYNQGYLEEHQSIILNFIVADNTKETIGYMQFNCSTSKINSEIAELQNRFLGFASVLIILVLAISVWSRTKLLSLNRHQAMSQASLEMIERNNRQLQIENKILEIISDQRDLGLIGIKILKIIADYLKTDRIVLFAHLDNELIKVASLKEDAYGKAQNKTIDKLALGQGVCGSVALSRKAQIIGNTADVSEYIADGENMLSEITAPIIFDGELFGIIDAEHPEKNFFTQNQLEFLTKISTVIGIGLKNSLARIQIEKKDAALKTSAERLENLIESLPRGIAFENNHGEIAHLNQKFISLMGLTQKPEELLGMHCNEARKMLSSIFENPDDFIERTEAIIMNRKIVADDTLKLLDGRSLTRHFAPVHQDGEFIGNLWAYADNTIETRFFENLNFEREKYMNIIANMELGLLEVDNDDRILTANNAFCSMTQYLEHELIGKIGYEVLVSEPEAERIKTMNAKRIDGESNIYEIKYLTKNKEERYMLVSGGPNRDIQGNVIGSLGVHLDITKLKELEALREDLIKDLTASNDELSNYAHVVSHDLKTPLRSISAAMAWLKEDNTQNLDEMSFSYLEIVDDSLLKMEKIISDTLRYSELKKELAPEIMVDLNHLVNHLISDLKKIYPDSKIQIEGTLPQLLLNETKALQVFQNILDNACKYRDPNRASRVTVRCSEVLSFFEFEIQDNGIGIPEESAHHVFEIFQKLNNNADSNGIGMSIVKKIIESYGGKVWLESQVGQGTTVMIQLPQSMSGQG